MFEKKKNNITVMQLCAIIMQFYYNNALCYRITSTILYVNNMILLGNFYYRIWHTTNIGQQTSWSKTTKHLS